MRSFIPTRQHFCAVVAALGARGTLAYQLDRSLPADQEAANAELSRIVSDLVPRSGVLRVTYGAADSRHFGEETAAYDFGTGAFCRVNSSNAILFNANRGALAGPSTLGGLKPIGSGPGFDTVVESEFPFLIVRDLLNRPAGVTSVQRRDDGNFVVTSELPGGFRYTAPPQQPGPARVYRLIVDATGHVIRTEIVGVPGSERTFTYSSTSRVGEMRLPQSIAGGMLVLKSFAVGGEEVLGGFDIRAVEALAVQTSINVDRAKALAADRPSTVGAGGSESSTSATAPNGALTLTATWKWPVIGAGLVLVVAGIGAWIRKRA